MQQEPDFDNLGKTTITLPAELGLKGVLIEISERAGDGWILRRDLTEALQGHYKIDMTFLPELDLPLEAGTGGLESIADVMEAMLAVGEGPHVLGMDVSIWQGFTLSFERARSAGVKYCFIRAGSGHTAQDPNYDFNYREAGRTGMLRGIYYYLDPEIEATVGDTSMEGQARRFAAMLKPDAELGAVLDVEARGLGPQDVQRFVDEFQKHDPYGRPIMIYTANWFWNVTNRFAFDAIAWAENHPLWVADHTSFTQAVLPWPTYKVAVPAPWPAYDFHQWTQFGGTVVQHTSDKLDLNHFPGTIADLLAWSRADSPPEPAQPLARKRVVVDGRLNLRTQPNLDGQIITSLADGDEVDVYEEGVWDYITAGGQAGYAYSQYLEA